MEATPSERSQFSVEKLTPEDITLRALNPEDPIDFQLAKALDEQTLEALHAFYQKEADPKKREKMKHQSMSNQDILQWMTDRSNGFMRVIEARDEQHLTGKRVIGFVYFYDDSADDEDFQRRVKETKKRLGPESSDRVWEMNFFVTEGTADAAVAHAVGLGMTEFAGKITDKTTTVMFADAGDVRKAVREAEEQWVSIKEFDDLKNWDRAEVDQDVHVLRSGFGFEGIGRMRYDEDSFMKDLVLATKIIPGQVYIPQNLEK